MEIAFVWSWLSFIAGVLATVSFGFWAVLWVAFVQYRKNQKQKLELDDLFRANR